MHRCACYCPNIFLVNEYGMYILTANVQRKWDKTRIGGEKSDAQVCVLLSQYISSE